MICEKSNIGWDFWLCFYCVYLNVNEIFFIYKIRGRFILYGYIFLVVLLKIFFMFIKSLKIIVVFKKKIKV